MPAAENHEFFSLYILDRFINNVAKCFKQKCQTLMTSFFIVHQCYLCDEFCLGLTYIISFF
jgi:hypothetical protein